MEKYWRVIAVLSCILVCPGVFADAPVYEVTKGKTKIYLAGTVHLLRPQDFPLPPEFDEAYKRSQTIVFETDLQKAKAPEFAQGFMQAMMLPAGQTLKEVLSAESWAALEDYANKNQFSLNQFMSFSPAMVSILITMGEAKKNGVGDGVDAYYDGLARGDKKVLGEMESANEVIEYMKKLSNEDPNAIIKSALADVDTMSAELEKMISSWRSGDLEILDKTLTARMRNETPEMYKVLIVERNQKWLVRLNDFLETPDVEMVLVGGLHLTGKDGLIAQLRHAGCKVKPLTLKK